MKKRPIFPVLIAIAYIFLPVFYYVQVALLDSLSLLKPSLVLSHFSASDIILSISSVLVGIGIYQISMWGWYLFLAHAIGVIIWNIYLAITFPPFPKAILLLFSLTTLSVIGIFLSKSIRTPYFNPKIRWWKQEKRYELELATLLQLLSGQTAYRGSTLDISASGLFFVGNIKANLGEKVKLNIEHEYFNNFNLEGDLVWLTDGTKRHPEGCGIKFSNLSRSDRRKLRASIKKISSVRVR